MTYNMFGGTLNPTLLLSHSLKQSIWPRIALCGGCCQCQALRNLKVACQKQTNERLIILF